MSFSKLQGAGFALLLAINGYFVRDLVVTLKATQVQSVKTDSRVEGMAKELTDMKESVRGMPELRIDVAVLKFAVQQMQTSINEVKAKQKGFQ